MTTTIFIQNIDSSVTQDNIKEFNNKISRIITVGETKYYDSGLEHISKNLYSSEFLKELIQKSEGSYTFLYTGKDKIELNQSAIERFIFVAESTDAALVYSDFNEIKNGAKQAHPVIDYQFGSLRDDFCFGDLLLINNNLLKEILINEKYQFAGIYDLRLKLSRLGDIVRIPEFLYTTIEADNRKSGQKLFDYVDPKNRENQIEKEEACTKHLEALAAIIDTSKLQLLENDKCQETIKASVIIPVRNRVKTIKDAIESVLIQETNFDFNLIIVDNHSTDGTTELIKSFKDERIIHLIPTTTELGIGGCWNLGVSNNNCGQVAIQLDSDDIYSSACTIQKIVDKFDESGAAMVIGSYKITDFDLNEIPPGIIDHKEWTDSNGMNNALRINGLGAPRAFSRDILREIKIPNVSYGEDYAVAIAISRNYKIERIYDVLYLCRRWEDNSDASLDIVKQNNHNVYKDRIRTIELKARIKNNLKLIRS
jgi:hypothetical protein